VTITVDPLNAVHRSVDGVLLNKNQGRLIQCPPGKAGSLDIPSGSTSIAMYAFSECSKLDGVTIPSSVTNIESWAFSGCSRLASVYIPEGITTIRERVFAACVNLTNVVVSRSLTNIEDHAFLYCPSLTGIYFQGNAPGVAGFGVFSNANRTTVYYLPGTGGWGATFGGRPTAVWQPRVLASDGSLGVRTNQFGFNISWAEGMTVVVDACTNLANPIWAPLQTNTFTSDTLYFSDPQWTNYPARFYRVRWP
jgi:hypothetical protein